MSGFIELTFQIHTGPARNKIYVLCAIHVCRWWVLVCSWAAINNRRKFGEPFPFESKSEQKKSNGIRRRCPRRSKFKQVDSRNSFINSKTKYTYCAQCALSNLHVSTVRAGVFVWRVIKQKKLNVNRESHAYAPNWNEWIHRNQILTFGRPETKYMCVLSAIHVFQLFIRMAAINRWNFGVPFTFVAKSE